MTTSNPITAGCVVYVRKGCPALKINKGDVLSVLEVTQLGADWGHFVKVRFQARRGVLVGQTFALYARHINRLSDPFTRLHQGDPTKHIEVEFLTAGGIR